MTTLEEAKKEVPKGTLPINIILLVREHSMRHV